MNTLEISNLCKDYGDFRLDKVSFDLPQGYVMGLIGPNGAGKTTIIKIIMNLVMKQEGQVKLFGKDHREYEVAVKKRIGFVYDTPGYYQHLNLRQLKNVVSPFYENWDEAVFERLVDHFNLPLNKTLKKFSKGMGMKASIALAMSHHADFLIMDEPTSGLDPVIRREVLEFFREFMQREDRSILFSSHITTDIEQVADYITYIRDGRVIFSRTKDEVFEEYALVKGGNDLLDYDTRSALLGVRSGAYGFEGLTHNVNEARAVFGDSAVYDRATLEDIMFFTGQKSKTVL